MWRFFRNRLLLLCLHTIFRALIYWAHRAVILAIARHLVEIIAIGVLLGVAKFANPNLDEEESAVGEGRSTVRKIVGEFWPIGPIVTFPVPLRISEIGLLPFFFVLEYTAFHQPTSSLPKISPLSSQ